MRVASLDATISTFGVLENSTQGYSLSRARTSVGDTKYDMTSGNININFVNTANFVHEVTHAGQFENGDIAYSKNSGLSYGQDLFYEVAAYKAELGFSGTFVGGSNATVRTFSGITPMFVRGITGSSGQPLYHNHGIGRININSSREE